MAAVDAAACVVRFNPYGLERSVVGVLFVGVVGRADDAATLDGGFVLGKRFRLLLTLPRPLLAL